MSSLLEVRDVHAHYRQRAGLFRQSTIRAVNGVSLDIGRGETVALVGESGSGKTTLGRSILGLMDVAGGKVVFDGTDLSTLSRSGLSRVRRRLQAVFQDPYSSISPYMTVYEIVEEPLLIHAHDTQAERRARVMQALEQVKLTPADDFSIKYPHALSGGQRQRVSLARAMVLGPELVIADEPVSMVDASSRITILSLFRDIQRASGTAFLYITHDITSARHFSDRIAVMYGGRIVETGPTGVVIDNPLHPYTRALLAAVPDPDPRNRNRLRPVVPGEPPSGDRLPGGCLFHPRCPEFRRGICDTDSPPLAAPIKSTRTAVGHEVACVLYRDVDLK